MRIPKQPEGTKSVVFKMALSIPDAIAASGVGRTLLYREIQFGRLKAKKAGGRTLILTDDLEDWLANLPAA